MKLGPSLDESLLALRDKADDERDWRNGKNGGVLTVLGVEMRDVMALRRLGKHPNNDTVKA